MSRPPLRALAALAALLLVAPAARAADFYVSGNLAISSATLHSGGSTQFFTLGGSDSDSSPAYGGSLGFGFGLDEAWPRIGSWRTWPIVLRVEVEGMTGRDYEFRTRGAGVLFTDVESWSILPNLWVDVPIHDPIAQFAGRIPILEPLFLYGGGGIGGARLDASSTDGFASGSKEQTNLAWQAGAGVGYAFNDWATFTVGYRHQDLGSLEVPLSFQPGVVFGLQELDLEVDEFCASLRIDFYTTPLGNLNPARWSLPDWERPRWLGGAARWQPGR